MKADLTLIVGASGTVGSKVVEILKASGQKVRTTTSKKVPVGQTEQVHLNLATGEGLKAAFEGVDKAFLITPPGYADQYAMLSPLIQEAKRRGLKRVVLMTVLGANNNAASGFRRAEIELEKSGLSYNIVRPNFFMQNFNTFWLQGIIEQKKIFLPAGQSQTSFIDARDISAVVAKLLMTDEFKNQAFDLTGSEALNHDQVANTVSEARGQKISYQEISPEDLKKGLLGAGLPEDYSNYLLHLYSDVREGRNARVTNAVKTLLGRSPLSLRDYAQTFQR